MSLFLENDVSLPHCFALEKTKTKASSVALTLNGWRSGLLVGRTKQFFVFDCYIGLTLVTDSKILLIFA